jgi:hypothetical protein
MEQNLLRAMIADEFSWRVMLAKLPNDDAVSRFAISEAKSAREWITSASTAEGSFLWCCDYYDMEPSAVRRAVIERNK